MSDLKKEKSGRPLSKAHSTERALQKAQELTDYVIRNEDPYRNDSDVLRKTTQSIGVLHSINQCVKLLEYCQATKSPEASKLLLAKHEFVDNHALAIITAILNGRDSAKNKIDGLDDIIEFLGPDRSLTKKFIFSLQNSLQQRSSK